MSIVVNKTRLPATNWQTKSGAIVSIDDARQRLARSLKVHMLPRQDLHGYDNPWPAGGGSNKWDEDWQKGYYNASGNYVPSNAQICSKNLIPVIPEESYYFFGTSAVGTSGRLCYYDSNGDFISRSELISLKNQVISIPAGCYYIMFHIDYPGDTYTNSIAINYPPTVTSYAPYSNICPITGWTQAKVTRTGRNLFSGDKIANASITFVGAFETNNSNDVLIARVFEGEKYTFTLNPEGITLAGLFTEYPTTSSVTYNNARLYLSGATSYTVTIPQGVKYIGVRYLKTYTQYQLELGSTASSYEPYNGQTVTIQLGQTVYGGTVDIACGELVVDRAMVDLGTLNPYKSPSNLFAYHVLCPENGVVICSAYKTGGAGIVSSSAPDKSIFTSNSIGSYYPVIIKDSDKYGYTENEFKTAMNGVQLCYELATPITIQLTPQHIQMLMRDNTLWSDADSVEVEYAAVHQHG